MKVAALQMVSTPDVARNLATAERLIRQAAADGAELVALPEYFCLMGQRDRDKLAIAEPDLGDALPSPKAPMQSLLARLARELGLWLVGGTLPLHSHTPERVCNSVLVYAPQGQRMARYDKIHLFCFDDGTQRYDEGATLQAGRQPVAFTATDRQGQPWRVGLGVCYDLRFPELFRALSQPEPCDLFILPAAFTHTTGQAHWEVLLRARAIENLAHVLAPAQGGLHENGRRTFGHSLAIGPWGEVLAVQAEGEGVVMATLDRCAQATRRQQLPALQHRVL
ncbi:carbon-nitrogen hydrolase family protein [Aquabacterium lacunae]|uniref:Carbon-nitrogen hydrolase family protein n=1 Tax=Aquabacterium lacunae TaxID=2528630 RepID=A0A4V2JFR4_9BURK|nr:carbon-nitrogen hydrolase family protein [Aquabacterium lacunae]TBO31488.1 carbon-nitrogen hydrolase family protein [Aquabacterium lacunae]